MLIVRIWRLIILDVMQIVRIQWRLIILDVMLIVRIMEADYIGCDADC